MTTPNTHGGRRAGAGAPPSKAIIAELRKFNLSLATESEQLRAEVAILTAENTQLVASLHGLMRDFDRQANHLLAVAAENEKLIEALGPVSIYTDPDGSTATIYSGPMAASIGKPVTP
jgi:hypothetical protein